jgi:DNA-binding NarL/FixJ family response regulator
MPVDAAVSRTLAGRALAQAGHSDRAVAELQHAAAELHACGALKYRAAAERELRRLGQHIHRRSQPGKADGSGVESLTSRELQIARLVVDRKTNPEIAEVLFLSPKTVETHMRNCSASSMSPHASSSRAQSSSSIVPGKPPDRCAEHR